MALSIHWNFLFLSILLHKFGLVRALYMPDELNLYMDCRKEKSVEEADKFFLHIFVDVAVAGEGFAAFFVAAE